MLEIDKIKEGLQARAAINNSTISEYVEHLKNGGKFPPIIVFFDSKDYWLADGWHRLLAHKEVGHKEIHEEIKIGTKRDALKYALGANSAHGLPRTNADKRNAVLIVLADIEWSKLTTRVIAEMCGVSHNLVSEIQRSITAEKKTEKNNTISKQSAVIGLQDCDKPLIEKEEKNTENNVAEPEIQEEPEYSEIDALNDQITELQNIVAAGFIGTTDEERASGLKLIADLRQEIKTLNATLEAITISRDTFQRENCEMKKQLARQRKEIERLMGK